MPIWQRLKRNITHPSQDCLSKLGRANLFGPIKFTIHILMEPSKEKSMHLLEQRVNKDAKCFECFLEIQLSIHPASLLSASTPQTKQNKIKHPCFLGNQFYVNMRPSWGECYEGRKLTLWEWLTLPLQENKQTKQTKKNNLRCTVIPPLVNCPATNRGKNELPLSNQLSAVEVRPLLNWGHFKLTGEIWHSQIWAVFYLLTSPVEAFL